jgi:ATP-dependent RNA helicase DHX57
VEGGRRKVEGGRRKEGRRKEEGGRRKEEGGRRKEEGGRRKEEGGRRMEGGREEGTYKGSTEKVFLSYEPETKMLSATVNTPTSSSLSLPPSPLPFFPRCFTLLKPISYSGDPHILGAWGNRKFPIILYFSVFFLSTPNEISSVVLF